MSDRPVCCEICMSHVIKGSVIFIKDIMICKDCVDEIKSTDIEHVENKTLFELKNNGK